MNLFIDIETIQDTTIPQDEIDRLKEERKDQYNFLAEYHSILCISIGYTDNWEKKIKTLSWDEESMIKVFYDMVKTNILVGFNIIWFDIPFIVKRGLHYGIPVPNSLKMYGRKPWEVNNLIDLYQVYKINSYNSASMDTVCKFLWLQSSKEEWIDGSMVQWLHNQWRDQEIYNYCERDVSSTIDIYEKFKSLNFI